MNDDDDIGTDWVYVAAVATIVVVCLALFCLCPVLIGYGAYLDAGLGAALQAGGGVALVQLIVLFIFGGA